MTGKKDHYYAVEQIGYAIMGVGETIEAAIKDTSQYSSDFSKSELVGPNENIVGAMRLLPCTPALYNAVKIVGGDILYDTVRLGYGQILCLPNETLELMQKHFDWANNKKPSPRKLKPKRKVTTRKRRK